MAAATIKATFHCPVEKVWQTVVSLTNYSWRSDIDHIEIKKSGKKFREHPKKGAATTFRITARETGKRYELDIENSHMKGHFIGLFSYENGVTTLEFAENVKIHNIFMKPFGSLYLKKQQARYMNDLRKAVEK